MGSIVEGSSGLKVADILPRLLSIPFGIAAIWLIVTNQQDDSNDGKLVFSNLMGLKYMICISAISVGYASLATVFLWVRCLMSKPWIFFACDQIVAYLMVTSFASVVEILYLAYNGDQKITWSEACSIYLMFCDRLKLAVALHAISLCCFCLLANVSAYRFFSRFDPPYIPANERSDREPNDFVDQIIE